MILDLDHESSLDPVRAGAKAASLARARRAGLPVLPGLVVESAASIGHMRLGAERLAARGSGGARLSMTAEPLGFGDELVAMAARLGSRLVARSSTRLEGSAEFAGAFTSLLDLRPEDLPRAVTGCWASAFSVGALQRLDAAGIAPGSFPMAVLVQPELDPEAGGTASIEEDGTVVVIGVKGSPAPLLQGWSPGQEARLAPNGAWRGQALVDLVGLENLDALAAALGQAREVMGVARCEWALDGDIRLLQLATRGPAKRRLTSKRAELTEPLLVRLAQAAMVAPGSIGEELVIPWAMAGLPAPTTEIDEEPGDVMARAIELRDELLEDVWGRPVDEALTVSRQCVANVLGADPGAALGRIRRLSRPDPSKATRLLLLVDRLRQMPGHLTRLGVGRWEPFVASVTLTQGKLHHGVAAAPGVGAGVRSHIPQPGDLADFTPRDVITAPQPIPNLAPLLWDAAGVVTSTGSPAAHLFESSRALGVPAVCGVELPAGELIVAVDGSTGTVATLPRYGAGP